jgi:hypothetical protein
MITEKREPKMESNWAKAADNQITGALLAAIAAGTDPDAAKMDAAITAVSNAALPIEAVTMYQAAAGRLDRRRPGGIGGPDALPAIVDGEDWTWCRVDTRGTGNGGRWIATWHISERARALRNALMGTLARLLPGFDVAFLATKSLFWENEVLAWLGIISPEEALWLGNQPPINSRHDAARIERQGFTLPRVSIPRTAAAVALAAEAARRAK